MAARSTSAILVNRYRLVFATSFVVILHTLLLGELLPLEASLSSWGWLGISGAIGLALGDVSLFQAFVLIGPRLSMLVFALAPVVAGFLAWVFLSEALTPQELLGVAVALGGVFTVVAERRGREPGLLQGKLVSGLLFAAGGMLGQAVGMVTAKLGLVGELPALSGNVIRLLAAAPLVWLPIWTSAATNPNDLGRTFKAQPRALTFTVVASFTGPALGVWLSLVAVDRAPVGIATTLMSLTPVFLLPISRVVFGQPITPRALGGTVITALGVALLLL
jgi:drug/metabolite transporter (DMT)-like permease